MCISCDPMYKLWWRPSNADLALQILETESGPISVYDVWRVMRRDFGGEPNQKSIGVSLASDLRFCWAGKGLYGLYRHKLIPGPRNLAGVAKFLLYSLDIPVNVPILAFLMRFMGYRFQQQSLANALARDPDVRNFGLSEYGLDQNEETARTLNRLCFAPSMLDFHVLADRWRGFMLEGIKEYEKRTC